MGDATRTTYRLEHPDHPGVSLGELTTEDGREAAWEMLLDGLVEVLDLTEVVGEAGGDAEADG